jgi:catechol 2,3-dioxygenase-like lactoylglutathione lyase family enzyme
LPGPRRRAAVSTYGLTHVALAVKDPARSFRFYRDVFGVISVYRSAGFVQAQTPGSHDVIVFEKAPKRAGKKGGVAHIGFRLTDPADLEAAGHAVVRAGGKILELGMFAPGEPYLFASDPDGYVVEIWYERPTPVDPRG